MAIIAIGMTLVIITTGIDLSVGSLIAFSGVVTALCIQALGGDSPGKQRSMGGGFRCRAFVRFDWDGNREYDHFF